MEEIDRQLLFLLNGLAGRTPLVDRLVQGMVNDYFVPTALALFLLSLWFAGRDQERRQRQQWATLCAISGVGVAQLAVNVISQLYYRPRPFATHTVTLVFYPPTDPSFPSNPAAIAFAIVAAVFMAHRGWGLLLGVLAALFSLSRVYAGGSYPLDVFPRA